VYNGLLTESITGAPMVKLEQMSPSSEDRVAELQRQLEDLKRRFPAHSLTPALMRQVDELEDALEDALARRELGETNPSGNG